MLWYNLLPENIKKRACRYLLQRYLGNFLEEKLNLNQLNVDLYNGTGTVSDVSLDCDALNALGDAQNWPLEIVDGHMKEISISVPWSTVLHDDSIVVVNGLSLTVQPKVHNEQVSSMLDSMLSSMSTSMEIAAECLKEEDPDESQRVEGIEMFAHTIDSILNRVKIKFENTKIRIEHVPKNGDRGIALEIHIKSIDYFDEAGAEPKPNNTDTDKTKTYIVASRVNKIIKFEGVTLYTDEYPSKFRTMARSLIMEKSMSSQGDKTDVFETSGINYQSAMSDMFFETRSFISTVEPEAAKETPGEAKAREFSGELSPEEKLNQRDPILFAKLVGEQELTLKLRHANDTCGPKIELNIGLGSLIVFMTPRQLHTLIELVDALNQPDLEDTSNIPIRPTGMKMQCKPMKQTDFKRIEAQMQNNMSEKFTKPVSMMHGWSGPSYAEENEFENEMFLPMTSVDNQMTESFMSSAGSMTTSMTSSVHTAAPSVKKDQKAAAASANPSAETSHVSLRITSVACILLHKDILVPSLSVDCISAASAAKMQEVSTNFYKNLEPFSIVDDFTAAHAALDVAAGKNHLRLLTSEITVTGSEKLTSQGSLMMCEVGVKHFILRECLYYFNEAGDIEPQGYDLIRFEDKEEYEGHYSSLENLKLTIKQVSRYMRGFGEKKLMQPSTDIAIYCTPFYLDVELTLIERMSATFFGGSSTPASSPTTSGTSQNHYSIALHAPSLDAVLRFPIADLRPGINRATRRVRPDYLMFQFHSVGFSWQQAPSPRPLPTTVTVRCTMLDLYYHENDTFPGTHIARTTMDDVVTEGNILSGHHTISSSMPTISITFKPSPTTKGPFDTLTDDSNRRESLLAKSMTTSMYMMNALRPNNPSPFSSMKQAHQSLRKDENSPGKSKEDEIIVPGSKEEMAEFTSSSIDLSSVHLEFILPILSLQLESKHLYEILYNRINSDLLLWEPQMADEYDVSPLVCGPINPAFGLCNKGYDSETDSTSSEEEHNMYHSTHGATLGKGLGSKNSSEDSSELHKFCLTLQIGKGILTMFTPVRDSKKRVVPGQMGELVLEARKLSMCHVSGLHGKAKTARLGLRSHRTTLYHDSLITIPSEKPPLRVFGCSLSSHLKTTIYPSGKGVTIKDGLLNKDMFTLALRVDPNRDPKSNMKTLCVALGIEQATLRHRGDKGIAWLTQLMDIIDVMDYPVPGYTPSSVVSELHVHITDCAVDYRPLYLPIRTVLTLGNFSVSSFMLLESNASCLRFLAQECTLFLMHLHKTKPNVAVPQDDHQTPDVVKDYVCVVDLGVFELEIRTEDKNNCPAENPQVNLTASNNMITLNTCWDSASALCRLITYIAVDGDSETPYERTSRQTSICSEQGMEQLVGLEDRPAEETQELSPNEIQYINDLMEEAMKESPNTTLEEDELNSSTEKEGVEIFFFPDESNMKKRIPGAAVENADVDEMPPTMFSNNVQEDKPLNIQVMNELGNPTPKPMPRKTKKKSKKTKASDGGNTDDEFCIIDAQAIVQDNEFELPVIKWAKPGPFPLIEDHFTQPKERASVLEAPKSYPLAVYRYTLLEMSINWNMYGGSDFRSGGRTVAKKTVTIEGDARRQGSPTAAKRESYDHERDSVRHGRAVTDAYRTGGVSWAAGSDHVRAARPPRRHDFKSRGGAYRDHDTKVKLILSKVKCQYEIYPAGGSHASRHVLAINKVEVIDQLAESKIHKLLSHYLPVDQVESPHSNMLVIKAVHRRPDPARSTQECCLKVSLEPLWINLDQDTLAFLTGYLSKLGSDEYDDDLKCGAGKSAESSGSRQQTPTHRAPVISIASHMRDPPSAPPTPGPAGGADRGPNENPLMEMYEAERLVSMNLIQLEEDFNKIGVQEKPATRAPVDTEPVDDDSPIYFRRVVFAPEVLIRLDYVAKRMDLSAGPVAGILMGLAHLDCSELTLRRLDNKLGLLGLEKLVTWALCTWLADIKRHQLPGLLGGLGPLHSVLQLVTGIRDLVWLPLEQWRRDGRLVYGIRRGAASFTARTAVAALDITTRLLHLIHLTAETAFDMLTPGPTLQLQDAYARRERRRRRRHDPSRHPNDIREGVANAYQTVREGFADTAATMAAAARWQHGVGVLRHLPGAAVAPLALAAAGAADVLGGLRASLAPHHARHVRHKWRAQPHEPHIDADQDSMS